MPSGAPGSAQWYKSTETPRRSARLETPTGSSRRTLPGGIDVITPVSAAGSASARGRNTPLWSQSHSANVSRDTAVSSYYLRAQARDESYDNLSGFGSLLRGSQRPSATPDKSIHASVLANDSLDWQDNDYSEEDRFVSQVEESTLDRSANEPPQLSNAMPHQERSQSTSKEEPSKLPLVWLLTALIASIAVYMLWNTWSTPAEPLIHSHGWREPGLGDVKSRISQLESAVNRVWGSVNTLESESKKVHASIAQRIKSLEDRVLPATIKALEADVLELHTAMGEGKRREEHDRKRIEDVASRVTVLERSKNTTPDTNSYVLLEERVKSTQRRVEELVSNSEIPLHSLKKHLPERMPVRFDQKTNMLHIDPAFWQELRRVFVAREDANVAAPNWSQFRDSNEASMDRILEGRIKDGAILSRDAFLKLLDAEIARAKLELTSRFNENVHGLQNDILGKVKKQHEMYEESGSWKPVNGHAEHDTDLLQRLIDAALARFAADQIGRADYAQYSAGGRVVPGLTSATHEIVTGSSSIIGILASAIPLPQLTALAESARTVRGRVPVVALHQDTSPGMCWPFSGTHGELGIRLIRRIHVTAVTIDHVDRSLSLDGGASAPRDIEAWGVLDSDADMHTLQRWRRNRVRSQEESDPMPVPPSPRHVFLGAFSYDAGPGAPAVQTFPVTGEAAIAGIPLRTIQMSFLSNYGLREFTCIYRVRVHGDPVE